MACCIFLAALVAQVLAFFRRGRAWLGLGDADPAAAPVRTRRRLSPAKTLSWVMFGAMQLAAVTFVAWHWEHIGEEVEWLKVRAGLAEPFDTGADMCVVRPYLTETEQ